MATPSVSVVVPVYNEARRLETLVASLRAQDYPGSVELVVVDGNSTDESMKILQHAAAESTTGPSTIILYVECRRARAAWALGNVFRLFPNNFEIMVNLGKIYRFMGRLSVVRLLLEMALQSSDQLVVARTQTELSKLRTNADFAPNVDCHIMKESNSANLAD